MRALRLVGVLVGAMLTIGCGSPPGDIPKVNLHPVMGIVTVDGRPAKGIHVVLHPVATGDQRAVTPNGITDETGVFKLTTYSVADGAPQGSYQLSFSWPEPTSPGAGDADEFIEKLPPQYLSAESSGVSLEVNTNTEEMPIIELSAL